MSKLEALDRFFNGVAWGTQPRVVARKADGSVYLLWVPGCTQYVNRATGRKYGSSSLRIVRPFGRVPDGAGRLGSILAEGGRLSSRLVLEAREKIDAEFGEGAAGRISIKETLVI